jgi:hypothetical protein
MSYPDLGCFAECLTCELCKEGLGPPSWAPDLFGNDLFPDSAPGDPDPYGLGDWAPPEERGPDYPWWQDFGSGGDLPDYYAYPWLDGFGASFGGEF